MVVGGADMTEQNQLPVGAAFNSQQAFITDGEDEAKEPIRL